MPPSWESSLLQPRVPTLDFLLSSPYGYFLCWLLPAQDTDGVQHPLGESAESRILEVGASSHVIGGLCPCLLPSHPRALPLLSSLSPKAQIHRFLLFVFSYCIILFINLWSHLAVSSLLSSKSFFLRQSLLCSPGWL